MSNEKEASPVLSRQSSRTHRSLYFVLTILFLSLSLALTLPPHTACSLLCFVVWLTFHASSVRSLLTRATTVFSSQNQQLELLSHLCHQFNHIFSSGPRSYQRLHQSPLVFRYPPSVRSFLFILYSRLSISSHVTIQAPL